MTRRRPRDLGDFRRYLQQPQMQCRCNVFSGRGARVVAVSGRYDGGVADRPLAHLSAAEPANVRTFVVTVDDNGIRIRDGKNIVTITIIILLYSWENTTEIGAEWRRTRRRYCAIIDRGQTDRQLFQSVYSVNRIRDFTSVQQ